MNKVIAIISSIMLVALSCCLVGCGNSSSGNNESSKTTSMETTTVLIPDTKTTSMETTTVLIPDTKGEYESTPELDEIAFYKVFLDSQNEAKEQFGGKKYIVKGVIFETGTDSMSSYVKMKLKETGHPVRINMNRDIVNGLNKDQDITLVGNLLIQDGWLPIFNGVSYLECSNDYSSSSVSTSDTSGNKISNIDYFRIAETALNGELIKAFPKKVDTTKCTIHWSSTENNVTRNIYTVHGTVDIVDSSNHTIEKGKRFSVDINDNGDAVVSL